MSTLDKLSIIFSSDPEYDKLVTEIYYEDVFVALINIDDGIENMKLDIPKVESEENIVRSVPLDWLIKALEIAKDCTINRNPDNDPWSLTYKGPSWGKI